ncbi:hypothetical protein ACWF94_16425 [Streptomyces sp. NPDC055078]
MGSMEKVFVTVDGTTVYEAAADRSARWNGYLMPVFSLATVKAIAEGCRAASERTGGAGRDEIRVVEAPAPSAAADEDKPQTAALVLHISWAQVAAEGPAAAVKVVEPDETGRYAVGARYWPWLEAAVHPGARAAYRHAFYAGVLREATWFEAQSAPDDPDATPGREWEEVEALSLDVNSVARGQRDRFTDTCDAFISGNAAALAGIPPASAGEAFWMSMRGSEGIESRSFRGLTEIPQAVRERLHMSAARHPFGRVNLHDGTVTFT